MKQNFYDLLDLQKHLRYRGYDSLDLVHLDKLRAEVDKAVKVIIDDDKKKREGVQP